jgi:UDP-N-acetylglucosamine 4-epimerase
MSLSNSIDKNTRILITGVAGFIGSNLLEKFLSEGLFTRGLDNFSTGFRENIDDAVSEAKRSNKRIKFDFIKGDIRDYQDCLKSTKNIDLVFHEAAIGSVQRSIDDPLMSNAVNVGGTINLLKASLENRVKRFIYASSSSIYGDSEVLPKIEYMEPNPRSIYAVTKLTAEYYCGLFYELYKLHTVSLRYFNVFGLRQNPNSIYSAVIPIFIQNLLTGRPLTIFGDGKQTRDFTYIGNVIDANIMAAVSGAKAAGKYFNIGCSNRTSLNDLLYQLQEYTGIKTIPVYKDARKGDVMHSKADITMAEKILNYRPAFSFKKGLELTVEWYRKRAEVKVLK